MSFLIAAAGTGGHVFPGLAVGEALVDLGVARSDILFVGGDRLESKVYPEEGFPFLGVEMRGLQRSLTPRNLTLPLVVLRARRAISEAIAARSVAVALAMGGYVTVPTGLAASRAGIPFMVAEQNARAGLANRVAARWSIRRFGSFPETVGLESEWVGNPVREMFWSFDRGSLASKARLHYELEPDVPTLGVVGGSLGAGALNDAVFVMVSRWSGPRLQVVHLTGPSHLERLETGESPASVAWRRVAFEESMELFYAACDLVLARAGGAVAELTATGTPSILVPGSFGSAGHQVENARFLEEAGAAVLIAESELVDLERAVAATLFDRGSLVAMRRATEEIARPRAAHEIGRAMLEAGT